MRRTEEQPSVQYVTMDFESAMWRAVSTVMPTAEISGCGFHWAQAVFRSAQECPGVRATEPLHEIYDLIQFFDHLVVVKLLALPYLPADAIASTFNELIATV